MKAAGSLADLVLLELWALATSLSCVHTRPHSRLLPSSLDSPLYLFLPRVQGSEMLNTGVYPMSLQKRHAVWKHGHTLTHSPLCYQLQLPHNGTSPLQQ